MSPALLMLLTFLAGVLMVAACYSVLSDVFLRDRDQVKRRLNDEFRKHQRATIQKSLVFKDLGPISLDDVENEKKPGLRARFNAIVEQSGLVLAPERLLLMMAMTSVAVGAVGGVLRQSILVGLASAAVGAVLPYFYVLYKRNARLEKLISQLPDAFDLMGRVIRAGQTMTQALQSVTDEFDQPIAGEFNYCYEQQNLGLSPELALRDLARRTGLLEIKIFVLAMLIQQQSGGNLAELLDKLSNIIRERFRIRGKIRALTAEGRMQAWVLLLLPVGMMFVLMGMSQNYADALAQHPNMIVAALVMEVFGALCIRKVVNFDY